VAGQPGSTANITGNARYYGTDATYSHFSGFYSQDSFMVLAYGLMALGNASRRRQLRRPRERSGVSIRLRSVLC
jgi:hypothetical protein